MDSWQLHIRRHSPWQAVRAGPTMPVSELHTVQLTAPPSSANWPAGQSTHALFPSCALYVPAWGDVQITM